MTIKTELYLNLILLSCKDTALWASLAVIIGAHSRHPIEHLLLDTIQRKFENVRKLITKFRKSSFSFH